jgi:hypothetical protein
LLIELPGILNRLGDMWGGQSLSVKKRVISSMSTPDYSVPFSPNNYSPLWRFAALSAFVYKVLI